MNFVNSFNFFGIDAKEIPCIKGEGAPTTETQGAVGVFYMDTTTGNVYKCTAVEDGAYTWAEMAGGAGLTEGSVKTEHIADDAVTGDKIGEKVITAKHLSNGAVEGGAIKTLAVTETRIRDGAVTTPKIKDYAITEIKLEDGAVSSRTIADGAVNGNKILERNVSIEHFAMDAVSESLHETMTNYGYTGSWADMIATLVYVLEANHIEGDGGSLEPPENPYE